MTEYGENVISAVGVCAHCSKIDNRRCSNCGDVVCTKWSCQREHYTPSCRCKKRFEIIAEPQWEKLGKDDFGAGAEVPQKTRLPTLGDLANSFERGLRHQPIDAPRDFVMPPAPPPIPIPISERDRGARAAFLDYVGPVIATLQHMVAEAELTQPWVRAHCNSSTQSCYSLRINTLRRMISELENRKTVEQEYLDNDSKK